MKATFGRITRSYSDLSGAYRSISLLCDKLLIFEHEPDEDVKKVHCHFVAEHNCSTKTLKNTIQANLPFGMVLNGNGDWSMPENNWDKDHKTITYMTKGHLEPKYNQGYTEEQINNARALWVEMTPDEEPAEIKLYRQLVDGNHKCSHPLYAVSEMSEDVQDSIDEKSMSRVYRRFEYVRKFFFKELRKVYKLPTPAFFRRLKTYTLGYCMDNEIPIPRQKDPWENYEN